MADLNLHLAAGLAVGSAIGIVPVARAWLGGRPLARPVGLMIVATCALALWSIMPNLLGKVGLHLAGHRVADVFVLHASLDRRTDGGLLIGEMVIAAIMVAQYLIVIAAVVRTRRRSAAR